MGGYWTGITISREQWIRANELARVRDLGNTVKFRLQSYDTALPDRHNLIIAIESLIHAPDPKHTIRNLADMMESSGRLIIVDDMPIDEVDACDIDVLSEFRRAWRCPVAPTATEWIRIAASAGLRLVARQDLSHLTRPRPEADLDAALADLSSRRDHKAGRGFPRLSDAEIGGIHLERLLGRGKMRYMMLVFEKPRG
jgi:hypothetical protein